MRGCDVNLRQGCRLGPIPPGGGADDAGPGGLAVHAAVSKRALLGHAFSLGGGEGLF